MDAGGAAAAGAGAAHLLGVDARALGEDRRRPPRAQQEGLHEAVQGQFGRCARKMPIRLVHQVCSGGICARDAQTMLVRCVTFDEIVAENHAANTWVSSKKVS